VERRFKRELLLARQVTHPNVVRIYDLGEIDGIKYITMSFVEGTDLATILNAEGRLPVSRALRIARSVVSGLRAAHAAGVVHRDLKPANIMIDQSGDSLIMDFGIALSTGGPPSTPAATNDMLLVNDPATASRSEATIQGSVVGTIAYMAPEQARGESVDQRADIYAFGLILHDALVGTRRLSQAEIALAELRSRMEQPPKWSCPRCPRRLPKSSRAVLNRILLNATRRRQSWLAHSTDSTTKASLFQSGASLVSRQSPQSSCSCWRSQSARGGTSVSSYRRPRTSRFRLWSRIFGTTPAIPPSIARWSRW
jgi:serine/threonine protein kinase